MFSSRAPAPARPAPPKQQASTLAPVQSAPPAPMQSSGGGGMMAGLASTVASGMAFGTGSAIAHRAVGAVANSFGGSEESSTPVQAGAVDPGFQQNSAGACSNDKQMFFECLQQNKGDQESCKFLYNMLQDCQRNQTQFASM